MSRTAKVLLGAFLIGCAIGVIAAEAECDDCITVERAALRYLLMRAYRAGQATCEGDT